MSNILYTQAAAQAMADKIEELIDKVYDLEVQLSRERHKNGQKAKAKPDINICPTPWPDTHKYPDITSFANMSIINEYIGKK